MLENAKKDKCMKKEKKQEFIFRITRANKTEMVIILYDMVLTYLQDALDEFGNKNIKAYKWNIERAKECLDELLNSLQMEYEPAGTLKGLYFFYKRELSAAAIQQDTEKIFPIMNMIKELKEAYEKIVSQDSSAPVMENAQSVYTGLTYGKDSMNIDLSDNGINRGFRV